MASDEQRLVRVAAIHHPALDVIALDLVAADRRPLAPFTPGAHIDVHVPNGMVRQYSLCGDSRDSGKYTIAVKREDPGRGGSRSLHAGVEVGNALAISSPRNHFPLSEGAEHSIFIAGGIGITPIYSMIRELARESRPWELHFCARSEAHAAFYAELKAVGGDRVKSYFSEAPLLKVDEITRDVRQGAHLYCCGPAGLMTAVKDASARWPEGTVHFEWFSAPVVAHAPDRPFEVELKKSNMILQVPADRSILQVVRDHGVDVTSSCEEGVCGTCETRVIAGEPEHRDMLLSDEERASGRTMMVCVSRAKSARIVLDL